MRKQLAAASLMIAFVGLAALRAVPARACSCAAPLLVPSDGSTGVALNTRVWVPDYGVSASFAGPPPPPRLRPEGGLLVDVDIGAVQDASGLRYLVLTPKAPLAPATRYVIESERPGLAAPSRFTTGDATDTTAPALPAGRVIKSCAALTPRSSCGERYRVLQFEIPTFDIPLVVFTGGDPPPPLSLSTGGSPWPPDPNPIVFGYFGTTGPTVFLGQGSCSHWPIPQAGATIFYGAVDLAGNFSGWNNGGFVSLPDYPTVAVADPEKHCVDPSMASTGGPLPWDSGPPPDGGVTPPSKGSGCAIGGRNVDSALPLLLAALALIGLRRRRSER